MRSDRAVSFFFTSSRSGCVVAMDWVVRFGCVMGPSKQAQAREDVPWLQPYPPFVPSSDEQGVRGQQGGQATADDLATCSSLFDGCRVHRVCELGCKDCTLCTLLSRQHHHRPTTTRFVAFFRAMAMGSVVCSDRSNCNRRPTSLTTQQPPRVKANDNTIDPFVSIERRGLRRLPGGGGDARNQTRTRSLASRLLSASESRVPGGPAASSSPIAHHPSVLPHMLLVDSFAQTQCADGRKEG